MGTHNGCLKMQIWQKLLMVAVLATATVVAGTFTYLNYFAKRRLIIATTTSLYDTGLLDEIEANYEANHPVDINIISLGTGATIQVAVNGDADVVLVHAPSLEKTFLEEGWGVNRKVIAYNYNETSTEPWYASLGSGMGDTLNVASQKNAYTISDIGTFLKFSKEGSISSVALLTEEKSLLNIYSVMAVNQTQPHANTTYTINFADSMDFIKYLVSSETQQFITSFGKADYDQSLFTGAVQPLKDNAPQPIVQWIKDSAFFDGTECPPQYRNGYPELYT